MRYVPGLKDYPAISPLREPTPTTTTTTPAIDPERALRLYAHKIGDALWALDDARAQVRWSKADGHGLEAQVAISERLAYVEGHIRALCAELKIDPTR